MKIAIFCDSFFPLTDGVTVSIKNHTELFSKKNKILFFVPSETDKLKIKNAKYFRLKSFAVKSYKEYKLRVPTFLRVIKELKRENPDIVHIHSIFGIGWEGLIAARLLKIPVVTTSHTVFPEVAAELDLGGIQNTKSFQKVTWQYMKWFLNKNTTVLTPSQAMKKELVEHGVTKPIYAISNGIDTKKFPYKKRVKHKETIFLSIGRLVESKHVDIVLKSFNKATKKGLRGKLWIVGKGPEGEKLKSYAKKNKIEKKVKFFGLIENDKVPELYKKADVFLTASTIETEGITTLEAMATGLPVVGVDARATPYLIEKDSGFIVPVGDTNKMSDEMLKLSKSFSLQKKLGDAAAKKAKTYELKEKNRELYKIYEKTIEKFKERNPPNF